GPDAFVLAAIVGAADDRALLVDRAASALAIYVMAIAVGVVANHIGLAQFPFDGAFFEVLHRKRETQAAARLAAEMNAAGTINLDFALISVLVLLVFSQRHAHALLHILLDQALADLAFASVKLFDRDQAAFHQQLDQGVGEGSDFENLARVGV